MIKATLFVVEDAALLNNGIFFNSSLYGIKNPNFMLLSLRVQLAQHGIELSTQDINIPQLSSIIISVDNVHFFSKSPWLKEKSTYLIISEPPLYYPNNWSKYFHEHFDRVFTYNTELVDNKKYCHYNFAIDLDVINYKILITKDLFDNRKMCILVAGSFDTINYYNKFNSLLYHRYDLLKWFAKQHPQELDWYSRSIDRHVFSNFRYSSLIAKLIPSSWHKKILNIVFNRRFRLLNAVYKGAIDYNKKISKLENYKFNIVYENTFDLPGYITEKIFDSFVARSVPVYWGESSIAKFIPTSCFVDRREFSSNKELYLFLKEMSFNVYTKYIDAIDMFMKTLDYNKYSSEANAQRICNVIIDDINNLQ